MSQMLKANAESFKHLAITAKKKKKKKKKKNCMYDIKPTHS